MPPQSAESETEYSSQNTQHRVIPALSDLELKILVQPGGWVYGQNTKRDEEWGTMQIYRIVMAAIVMLSLAGASLAKPEAAMAATPDNGAIANKYASSGGAAGRLGAAITPLRCSLPQGGCYQAYRHGSIYWSPNSGAYIALGGIAARWATFNRERGILGYPTSDENCTLANGGCMQNFQGGRIYWQSAAGANAVYGGIGNRWDQSGAELGPLGYPISGENCTLISGGCVQTYQGGYIYWQSSVGAHSIAGGIGSKWVQMGYERSPLGYPMTEESCSNEPRRCVQTFLGGTITWASGVGVSVVPTSRSIGVVVNKRRPNSPLNRAPTDLIWSGSQLMRREAANQMAQLIRGAAAAGVTVTTVSGFRSYDAQTSLYNYYVSLYGQSVADTISARPGYSEHQTGLVQDIGNPNNACSLQACFANTPAGKFAATNAWRYGFIIRYPNGYNSITGYTFEPWHLRYIGVRTATDMHQRGYRTLEQYFGLAGAPSY